MYCFTQLARTCAYKYAPPPHLRMVAQTKGMSLEIKGCRVDIS